MFPRMSHSLIASSSKDGANMCQFDARASMNCSNSGGKPSLLRADDCRCVSRTVPFQATDSFLSRKTIEIHQDPFPYLPLDALPNVHLLRLPQRLGHSIPTKHGSHNFRGCCLIGLQDVTSKRILNEIMKRYFRQAK